MRKKYNTLLVVLVAVLAVALLSWFLPTTYFDGSSFVQNERTFVGIAELLSYPIYSYYNFIYILVYLLLIGGMYALLNKVGAYKVIVEKVAKKFERKGMLFVTIVVCLLAAITAFTGYTFEALVFVPFIAAVTYAIGYDKVSTALVSIGGIVSGVIGNLFSVQIAGTLNDIVGVEFLSLWIPKVALLVVSAGLVILNVYLIHRKHTSLFNKVEKNMFVPTTTSKAKVWPLATLMILYLLTMILSTVNWSGAFGINVFETVNSFLGSTLLFNRYLLFVVFGSIIIYYVFKYSFNKRKLGKKSFKEVCGIKGIVFTCVSAFFMLVIIAQCILEDVTHVTTVFTKVYNFLGLNKIYITSLIGNTVAFGQWTYNEYIVIQLLFILLVSVIYRETIEETVTTVFDGFKNILYPTLVCMLAYAVLIITSNHPTLMYALKPLLELTDGLNNLTLSFVTFISGLCNTDFIYYNYGVFTLEYVTANITDTTLYPLTVIITQSMYGLAMLVAPTSIPLLFNLSSLDIKYGEWLKAIWKLFIELLAVCFIAFVIILLVI